MSGDQNFLSDHPSSEGVAIAVSGLDYRYPGSDRNALTGIDLTVPRGACFGLLGPNGAGKSTLLALMTGVLAPQTGEIVVAGHSARKGLSTIRDLGALVPQDFAFYPALTGRENLAFFAGVYRLSSKLYKARLEQAVAATQLSDWLDRRAETYSGGLKRRLNLAIGLLNGPRILYLDEPTVGIDARSRACIIEAIQALTAQGVTVVYTSHYMEEVEQLCDAVAVINQGRLVAGGRTDALLTAAAHQRLAVTLEAPLADRAKLKGLEVSWLADDRLEVSLAGGADLPAALAKLKAAGATVARAEYGVSRLEALYLSVLADNEAQPEVGA